MKVRLYTKMLNTLKCLCLQRIKAEKPPLANCFAFNLRDHMF